MGGNFNNALICCRQMLPHVRRASDEVGRICTQHSGGGRVGGGGHPVIPSLEVESGELRVQGQQEPT